MDDVRKKPGAIVWILAALIVALVGYVAAYAHMVRSDWVTRESDGTLRVEDEYHNPLDGFQDVTEDGRTIFAPINWLDRIVRRDAWTPSASHLTVTARVVHHSK